jgi:hypothetical protein
LSNAEQNPLKKIFRAKTPRRKEKCLLISPNLAGFASLREPSLFRFAELVSVAQFEVAGGIARLPIGGAETLGAERLEHPQGLFDAAADIGVTDDKVGNLARGV